MRRLSPRNPTVSGVCQNAAYACGCIDCDIRAYAMEPCASRGEITQVDIGGTGEHHIGEAHLPQAPQDRRADEACIACDVDGGDSRDDATAAGSLRRPVPPPRPRRPRTPAP